MSGYKNKFVSLKRNKDGKVILGNSAPTKVLGKGRAKLDKHTKVTDALLVQGLKQNILSVGQIVEKGHTIVFTSNKCKVIEEDIREVRAKVYINSDKLYDIKRTLRIKKRYNSYS